MIDVYDFFFSLLFQSHLYVQCKPPLDKQHSYSHSFFVLQVMDEGQWLHRGGLTTTS